MVTPGHGPADLSVRFLRATFGAPFWRELLHLVVTAPLAVVMFVVLVVSSFFGVLLVPTAVGIPLLALVLLGARQYGPVPRALASTLLDETVEAPQPRHPRRPGLLAWLRASFGDIDAWRAIAYIVVALPVSVLSAYAVVLAGGISVTMVTYPVWWQLFHPSNTDAQGVERHAGIQFGDFYVDTWPRALALAVLGLAMVAASAWAVRVVAAGQRLLVRGLLGPTRLSARVEDLETTRAHAIDDSAATLRRIERDLHDGTQARLVALAMHLDMAKDTLSAGDSAVSGADVERARELLDQAHRNTTETITELREVTRSIHPPALDLGLDQALATLAARSGVPAEVRTRIARRPSPAIETIAYYCVAELLANVARHSGARRASVEVDDDGGVLRVRVADDGGGGARLVAGHGLAGLVERVRTVDGRLDLSSPPGGPTEAVVVLPVLP